MSAASWLIEKFLLLSGAGNALSERKFYEKLRRSAIRFRKGERIPSRVRGVRAEQGVYCGMRYYLFRPRETDTPKSVIYLHGSGYMNAHRRVQERFAADLAEKMHAKVYFPIYPKLPEATAASCFAVVNNFCAFLLRKGEDVVLVGDSSGGALCLALADERAELRRVIAISPWLLLPPCEEAKRAKGDVVLSLDMLERVSRLWAYGLPAYSSKFSPFYGKFAEKEILLFAGEKERFLWEIERFAEERAKDGSSIECRIGAKQQHCYPLMPTPEGREARSIICRKLREWLYGGSGR